MRERRLVHNSTLTDLLVCTFGAVTSQQKSSLRNTQSNMYEIFYLLIQVF